MQLDALAGWFRENQRPLPWRIGYDPYRVWISEVMLQQTRVETVLPYYEKFLQAFPDIRTLASAADEEVLKLWAGLGYYRRAKNMMAAARLIEQDHHGKIPSDYESLIELPGIGRYMAGAVLSIAFNKAFPIVDGNVRRVLSRIHGWPDENEKRLWEAATNLVRAGEPRIVNQALMELGATICSFRSPRCLLCPVQAGCVAFKTGMQDQIPPLKKRQETVHIHLYAAVCKKGTHYLMKSSEGLWEFPTFPVLPAGSLTEAGSCRHTITHHRLNVSVYTGSLKRTKGFQWKDPAQTGMSSLSRKILAAAGYNAPK